MQLEREREREIHTHLGHHIRHEFLASKSRLNSHDKHHVNRFCTLNLQPLVVSYVKVVLMFVSGNLPTESDTESDQHPEEKNLKYCEIHENIQLPHKIMQVKLDAFHQEDWNLF